MDDRVFFTGAEPSIYFMILQFKHFRIPSVTESDEETAMNTFLRSVQVLTVHRDFVEEGSCSFTLFTVEYLFRTSQPGKPAIKKGKIDYREVLCSEDFTLFSKLRNWRKETATKEAVAVYTIFTNEQLAQMSSKRPKNKAELQKIQGVGEAKVSKYGQATLDLVELISKQQLETIPADETNR